MGCTVFPQTRTKDATTSMLPQPMREYWLSLILQFALDADFVPAHRSGKGSISICGEKRFTRHHLI
jgi:hypothetical protein